MCSRSVFVALLVGILQSSSGFQVLAQEIPEGKSLNSLVEAFEKAEKELVETRERLKTTLEAAERRRLEVRIKELEDQQRRILPELEKIVGPPPPAVRPQPSNKVVEQLEVRRLRNEALQDRKAEDRLSGQ